MRTKAEEADIQCATKTGQLNSLSTVFDARIYRVLKAVGCNPQLIGKPRRIGGTMSYAGLFDTGEGLLQALQAFREELGIEAPEAKELALA
jgi:acyl homoserine lactone synthase